MAVRHARRTHERIELAALEEGLAAGLELVAVVLADRALGRPGIVGLADAGEQQLLGVAEHEGRQDHDAGRLLIFLAGLHVGIDHAGDAFGLLVVD